MSSKLTEITDSSTYVLAPSVLLTGSRQRDVARWTKFGGIIPNISKPICSSSEVAISKINNKSVVKRIRRISDSPTDLDGEEAGGVNQSIVKLSCASPTQPPTKGFYSQVIPSTPRSSQPVLLTIPYSIPPPSPNTSTARPSIVLPIRPSPHSTAQTITNSY
ncbi:hypothetical protein O181_008708 [Austropuccinia psidii MF-1]|uniref:Uncharacterized protein n=1 Tax=Austropuccinia psidii MF-1 TaxID=1389203 RepID=A0A9Q3BPN3_9BASI|nr:hypothetical protein [Austropuccinia psidii MF-1]